jgi:hypothetical protein
MEENLFQLYVRQGINKQNTWGAQKLTLQSIKNPLNKGANELDRQF